MKTKRSVSRARCTAFGATLLGSSILSGAWARADVTAGHDLFVSRCAACHSVNPTRKPGPLLSGLFGRHAGSVPDYHYSAALKGAAITWNASTLDRWLRSPPAFIPGVNMQAQVDNAQDRQSIIAYLKSLGAQTATRDSAPSAR
jgi:cytochrome c